MESPDTGRRSAKKTDKPDSPASGQNNLHNPAEPYGKPQQYSAGCLAEVSQTFLLPLPETEESVFLLLLLDNRNIHNPGGGRDFLPLPVPVWCSLYISLRASVIIG